MGVIITIDGPAASGKTSVSRELARRLGFSWVSTGSFYRGLALLALRDKVSMADENALARLATSSVWRVEMSKEKTRVLFSDQDVTDDTSREEVGNLASQISQLSRVREGLLERQRDCARQSSRLIAEGRDCGTVVFPQAQVRIYLTAQAENRAQRRATEQGGSTEKIGAEQSQRDQQDTSRKAAPLRIPENAYVLDTTKLTLGEVVDQLEGHIRRSIGFSL